MLRRFKGWSVISLLLLLLFGMTNIHADQACEGVLCGGGNANRHAARTGLLMGLAQLGQDLFRKVTDKIYNDSFLGEDWFWGGQAEAFNRRVNEKFGDIVGEHNYIRPEEIPGLRETGAEVFNTVAMEAATAGIIAGAPLAQRGMRALRGMPMQRGAVDLGVFGRGWLPRGGGSGGKGGVSHAAENLDDMVTLYRGEGWDIGSSPRGRMRGGIRPHGRNLSIAESLDSTKAGKEFVSTTTSPDTAMRYTGKDGFGYIYEIQIPRNQLVDVNATYSGVLKPNEMEQLVRGGIDPKYIRRSFAVEHRKMTGDVYHNPSFVGGKNLPQGLPHVTETAFTRHLPENVTVR